MKKKKNETIINTEPPQKSLEKILKTEIQVAQQITEAKEGAEQSVKNARDEVSSIKEDILIKARAERDRMLAEGITEAEKKVEQDIESSRKRSEEFFAAGKHFIETAVSNVIDAVLGSKDGDNDR